MEKRGGALMADDRDVLEKRMRHYYDRSVVWEDLKNGGHPLAYDAARYDARLAREKVLKTEDYKETNLRKYALRPYDNRWCYYSSVRPLWNEPRPTLYAQCWEGNRFLMTRPAGAANPEGIPFFFTSLIADNDFLRGHAYCFPLQLKKECTSENDLFAGVPVTTANLSVFARDYLKSLGLSDPDETPDTLWHHALAIGYSPAYLSENEDGIRQDWPRIPLPATQDALLASAELGRSIAALLDSETQVAGVTCGKIRDDLKAIALCQRVDNKQINPDAGDLELTAGWGHAGKEGVTMPGRGRVEVSSGSTGCIDVYLNSDVCWKNIPQATWEMTIGGYQVLKKWLSYREKSLLSRSLTLTEARYFSETARRLTALIALYPSLDENYRSVVK